jgi:hypothetical protein
MPHGRRVCGILGKKVKERKKKEGRKKEERKERKEKKSKVKKRKEKKRKKRKEKKRNNIIMPIKKQGGEEEKTKEETERKRERKTRNTHSTRWRRGDFAHSPAGTSRGCRLTNEMRGCDMESTSTWTNRAQPRHPPHNPPRRTPPEEPTRQRDPHPGSAKTPAPRMGVDLTKQTCNQTRTTQPPVSLPLSLSLTQSSSFPLHSGTARKSEEQPHSHRKLPRHHKRMAEHSDAPHARQSTEAATPTRTWRRRNSPCRLRRRLLVGCPRRRWGWPPLHGA